VTERPKMHTTMMETALVWARRSTCSRLAVGAVLASYVDKRIIGTGYNGAPRGIPHCVHVSGDESCTVSKHAEENVVANAAFLGQATRSSVLYCTHAPCYRCAGLLINAGISAVYYAADYKNFDGITLLNAAGISTRWWSMIGTTPQSVS
jgi:dCMP deaminase